MKNKVAPDPGGKGSKALASGEDFSQKGDNSAQTGKEKDNPKNPP